MSESITLKQMRELTKLSQSKASRLLDITQDYLSLIENNKRTPSTKVIEKMALVYKQKPEQVFLSARRTYCAKK